MTRSVSTAVQAALTAAHVPMLVLVELSFSTGTLYACNAPYSFTWNGNTYLGLGEVGGIEPVKETGSLEANGIALRLTGVPLDGEGDAENIGIALGEHYQGRRCVIRLAMLSVDYQIIADPIIIFSGRMDTMSIQMGEQATITVTAESRLADLERPRVSRYNNGEQLAQYPGDLGLEFVEQMVFRQIKWGRA